MNQVFQVLGFVYVLLVLCMHTCHCKLHGGTFLALAGKDSIVLASDTRFSTQNTGPYLIGLHKRFIFRIGDSILVGCFGLENDAKILMEYLSDKLKNFLIKEIHPELISRLISDYLYNHSLMVTPLVIGFKRETSQTTSRIPYMCAMDSLGAMTVATDFLVAGTSNSGLYTFCESLYNENLDRWQLVTVAEKSMKNVLMRDVISGCQVNILTLTHDNKLYHKVIETKDS